MVGPEGLQVGVAPSGDGPPPGGDCAGGDWAGGYWAWAGAHGGAGTTTLCEAVPGGADFGRSLPEEAASPGLPAEETWEVPWVPAWRFGEAPAATNSPPQVRELLVGIWSALDLPLPGGANQKRLATRRS